MKRKWGWMKVKRAGEGGWAVDGGGGGGGECNGEDERGGRNGADWRLVGVSRRVFSFRFKTRGGTLLPIWGPQ